MAHTLASGRILGGRYRLDHEIAKGGMATVWRADDPLLARSVAIKTLDPALAEDSELRSRFRREAVAAAAVAHPNIVATYDTGEDDGVAYIVMELVDGATLRQAIDLHGTLPTARAADIAAQVADALAAAHARGLVHRDIKPSNVLIQLDGRAKVTDFGIAKASDQPAEDLTRTGSVMGTARYLSPEQLEGHTVDERSDIYALGLVLYEMLTATPPFAADSEIGTAVARLTTDPPRVIDLRPEVPPGLAHVVDRAMARAPGDRWPNAAAMRDALTPFRIAVPDRGADATMPVAMPRVDQTAAAAPAIVATTHPAIIDDGVSMSTRMLAWIGALLLGIVGGYAGYVVASDSSTSTTPAATVTTTADLPILGVSSFDPEGDQVENDGDLGNLTDGRTSTAWATEGYFNATTSPKSGVGFVLDLGEPSTVRGVDLTSDLVGWDAKIYVGSDKATDLSAWGEPVTTGTDLGKREKLSIDPPASGRYVLVWFTKLVKEPDGRFRGRIIEVAVRGNPG